WSIKTMASRIKWGVALYAGALMWATSAFGQTQPWFQDSFESGDLSKQSTREGSAWAWKTVGVSVTNAQARTGTHSVVAQYGPDADGEDTWKELIFRVGKYVDEIWVEYWVLFPTNYHHRNSTGPDNNKFFQ